MPRATSRTIRTECAIAHRQLKNSPTPRRRDETTSYAVSSSTRRATSSERLTTPRSICTCVTSTTGPWRDDCHYVAARQLELAQRSRRDADQERRKRAPRCRDSNAGRNCGLAGGFFACTLTRTGLDTLLRRAHRTALDVVRLFDPVGGRSRI